ncbi:hypothetical protein GGR30_003224 [Martelella radicis]|uniref:Uncharacterized protein n=1 Tax=Martelella radicis TaxID=1397476 RepID=A0A7W6PBA6_9HYPH|nr:hypothetical protein [Martelella radicis]
MAKKGRGSNFYVHGLRSGWTEFRYGNGDKQQKRPPKRLFNHNKRKQIVSQLIEVLDDFRQTRFEHEATCRHGLRSALCLEGHSWAAADNEAALLVSEALKSIGAIRPRWEEGQRYYADGTSNCNWCHGPIEAGSGRFCSRECARSMLESMAGRDKRDRDVAWRAAWMLINRTNKPKVTCEACGSMFHPHYASAGRFCSSACYDAVNTIKPRTCTVCGDSFKPKYSNGVCCSRVCAAVAAQRARKARKERLAVETRVCDECGTDFTPQSQNSRYCGDQCSARARSRAYRNRKKALSDSTIVCLPVPDPRPLTPAIFDGMLEAA